MRPRPSAALGASGALSALLFLSVEARPEAFARVGIGAALPTGDGEIARGGGGVSVGGALPLPEPHLLGVALRRFHYGGLSRAVTAIIASYRWRSNARDRLGFFLTGELGAGLFTGCIENGRCGGGGLTSGADLGLSFPLATEVRLELACETIAQTGMPAGAGTLFTPTFVAGVSGW
jgi:hypothetical protein